MELTGELKKQVENMNSKDEARKAIRKAGMELTDDELDRVAGGKRFPGGNKNLIDEQQKSRI